MSKWKIYECEELAKKDGGKYKKLVLKAEDANHTEDRVTLWDNHPQYELAVAGGTINGVLEKKDSGTPIPNRSGNYINRTLLAETNENGTLAPTGGNLESRVKKLEDKVFPKEEVIDISEEEPIK